MEKILDMQVYLSDKMAKKGVQSVYRNKYNNLQRREGGRKWLLNQIEAWIAQLEAAPRTHRRLGVLARLRRTKAELMARA
jgi:hypothetical protein